MTGVTALLGKILAASGPELFVELRTAALAGAIISIAASLSAFALVRKQPR